MRLLSGGQRHCDPICRDPETLFPGDCLLCESFFSCYSVSGLVAEPSPAEPFLCPEIKISARTASCLLLLRLMKLWFPIFSNIWSQSPPSLQNNNRKNSSAAWPQPNWDILENFQIRKKIISICSHLWPTSCFICIRSLSLMTLLNWGTKIFNNF